MTKIIKLNALAGVLAAVAALAVAGPGTALAPHRARPPGERLLPGPSPIRRPVAP